MDETFAVILILLWLGMSIGVAVIAGRRGKESFGWFFISLLISPLLALIFLIALPQEQAATSASEIRVKCARCAELILAEASACRFCGAERVPAIQIAAPIAAPVVTKETGPGAESFKSLAIAISLCVALVLMIALLKS